MRNHNKLKVFHLADNLTLQVYEATRGFPIEERFGLRSQMRRTAVSVPANIVEGAARPSLPDYVRFLSIAYGSARELEYELSIATRLGYIPQTKGRTLEDLASQTARALRSMIYALSPRVSGLEPRD